MIRSLAALAAVALALCAPAALAQNVDTLPPASALTGAEKVPARQGAGCATRATPCATVAVTPSQVATYLAPTFQAKDADLDAIAALSTQPFGRSLLTQADAAAARSTLGVTATGADPAYAKLTGATFTGSVQTSQNVIAGVGGSVGYVGLIQGSSTTTGYTAFYTPNGTRTHYIGFNTATGPLLFNSDSSAGFSFNNNVGIGTTNPSERLSVAGTASITGTLSIGGSSNTLQVLWNSGSGGQIQTFAGLPLSINPQGNNVVFNGSGNVGIGTASPGERLSVAGSIAVAQGNVTNKPVLNLTGLGAGTTGIYMALNAGGTFSLGDSTGGAGFITQSVNRSMQFVAINAGFDSSPQAFLFTNRDADTRAVMRLRQNNSTATANLLEAVNSANAMQFSVSVGGAVTATRYCYTATVCDYAGAGTPAGNVTAAIGSTYRRTDGGAGSTFYVKESGTDASGWVAK